MDGFKIRESPFWTIHLYMCDGGLVRNLDVKAHGHNNDGIDFEMSRNFLVEDCSFDQGDDAVVIKAGRNQDAWRLNTPCENIVIRNCQILKGHTLLGIGSEISGGIRNIYMHDCTAPNSVMRLFFVKTNHRRGGFIENVYMKNVQAGMAQRVLEIDTEVLYQWKDLVPTYEERITRIDGIYMDKVTCESADAIYELKGDAKLPVKNVTIKNVKVGEVKKFVKKVNNVETEEFLEWMEISKTDYPQVMGVTLALYRYGVYQAAGGRNQAFLDMDKKLTKMALDAYKNKEMAAKEYRHRAMTWGVQAAYYTALPIWLLNCWGVVTIADMLSMVSTEMVNTEDKHQAMLDLAYLYENMIMRNRSNGGYETGVEALWRFCEMFNIDIVIMYVHMGCKSMSGYHGLFEEEARKHGIHLIWVTHNLMCPEDGTRRDMRTEINRYMRTVFREEPLDPSLEDFDDSKSW